MAKGCHPSLRGSLDREDGLPVNTGVNVSYGRGAVIILNVNFTTSLDDPL